MQVNYTLVDSHLVSVPGLRTLTIWCLSGGDLQDLGWHSNRTLLDDLVLVGVSDDVSRNVLQLLDLGGSQGDSDLENLLFLLLNLFLVDWGRHIYCIFNDVVGEQEYKNVQVVKFFTAQCGIFLYTGCSWIGACALNFIFAM